MKRVLVTGSSGMLGRNFSEILKASQYELVQHTRAIVDLLDARATISYIESIKPSVIIHCAALVGGIQANILGGEAYYTENRRIDENLFLASSSARVPNFIYITSSCMYPANSGRLLTVQDIGLEPLEPTNLSYARAKIWATKKVEEIARSQGWSWRSIVSSNLYGPFDHFERTKSHLIASVIDKVFKAYRHGLKEVEMWGDGTPRREFTYAPELAEWVVSKLDQLDDLPYVINVGYGIDFTVRQYYEMVIDRVSRDMQVIAKRDMPNGNMNKLMDSSIAKSYGWNPQVSPQLGIQKTINWYVSNIMK